MLASYSSDSASSYSTMGLPEYLYSYETLISCDMNHHAASFIFQGYESAVLGFGEDCIDFGKVIQNVIESSKADACLEGDDWESALFELGANSHLVSRILDPHWKAVRLCRTAKEWIWFVVSSRLEFLELLDSIAREHQQRRQPRQLKDSYLSSNAAEEAPLASSTLQLVEHPPSRATSATLTQNPIAAGENSQVFYKGGLLIQLQQLRTAKCSIRVAYCIA